MSYFNKKIIYLSYMERGEKVKNAGFIRAYCGSEQWNLDMQVTGLSPEWSITAPVVGASKSGKEYPMGEIMLKEGKGMLQLVLDAKIKTWGELSRESSIKISVSLSGEKQIVGTISIRDAKPDPIKNEEPSKKAVNHDMVKPKKMAEQEKKIRNEKMLGKEMQMQEMQMQEMQMQESQSIKETAGSKEINLDQVILNDKWKQLMKTYPVVHPYEDEREYISMEPKDFVVMTGNYQHLANNSFLLHGFYNYRHVILGKDIGKENKEDFYLGVPGVYYEREKMVALMFGFEAFECAGRIAQQGKFGYYLRKVEI